MDRKKYLADYQRKWRDDNRDKVRKDGRIYYNSKPKEWRDKCVLKNKLRRQRLRIETIKHYGNKCACCGENKIEFLCIDHINNDGATHRKQMGTRSIGEWLYSHDYPKGFQVLCHNCNMAKGIYGYCPHKGGDAL